MYSLVYSYGKILALNENVTPEEETFNVKGRFINVTSIIQLYPEIDLRL